MLHYDKLLELVNENPKNEDGDPWDIRLLPGLSKSAIERMESDAGIKLNAQVVELLSLVGGIENGPMEIVDFELKGKSYCYTGNSQSAFHLLAPDGFGNEWVVDYNNINENYGPIFYYQHEGPMYFYQCDTLFEFIDEYIKLCRHPFKSKIDDLHELKISPVKDINNGLLKAVDRNDVMDAVRPFVKDVEIDNVYFKDFTGSVTGDGFDLRGYKLLAILKKGPVIIGKKKVGLWQRIFS